MAQPLTAEQLQDNLDKVAASVIAGNDVDISQLTYAAGCAIKLAGDDSDAEMLTALVLVGSGNYEQAVSLIFKLAMADARADSADADDEPEEEEPDLITGILSSGGPAAPAAAPAPKPRPRPTKAAAPAAPAAPAPAAAPSQTNTDDEPEATGGRRGRRRASRRAGQPGSQQS